jgi:hypothetical protein
MAKEQLLPNSTEQTGTANQIAIPETNTPLSWKAFENMMTARRELASIQISDKIKNRVKVGALAIGTVAASTALMMMNPDKGFAQTQGDAPKVEQGQNGEIFDIGSLSPRAFQRLVDIRGENNGFNTTNQRLKVVVKKNKAPKNLIPKEVLDIDAEDKGGSIQQPSQPTRVIEQPTQSVQVPKPPSSEGFPFLPLAIAGAAAIGGAAFYNGKLKEVFSGNKKEPKRYKGKGNEQFGMPNTDPDGTNSLELADRIAQQKRALQQSEQVELVAFQDLAVLEQALEEAVKDGMRPNSIAYRKAEAEINKKKAELDKKYLS